jgi:hypothetical protein
MTSRAFSAIVSIGLCGAVLEPLVRAPDDDGFPLSTFPMFAAPRPSALTVARAEAATRDGRRRPLPPAQLGTDEVMQAFSTLQRAAEAGPEACATLCAAIATRVAADAALAEVVEIRLVIGTYDALAVAAHGAPQANAADEAVLARCDVGERSQGAGR